MDNRRRPGHTFKVAKLSRRYYLFVLIAGLFLSTIFGIIMLDQLHEIQTSIGQAGLASEPVLAISDKLLNTAMIFFFTFVAFTIITTILVLWLEGRISGAMVAILDVLNHYVQGNFDYDRQLRTGDELGPIMATLKELGKKLKGSK